MALRRVSYYDCGRGAKLPDLAGARNGAGIEARALGPDGGALSVGDLYRSETMTTQRPQRRVKVRALIKAGEAALRRGLPLAPERQELSGLAFVLAAMLGEAGRADRASRTAAMVHAVFTASARATRSQLDLACRKGCGYCCHTWVSATAPELFLLASTLAARKAGPATEQLSAVLGRAAVTAGLTIDQRFGAKLPCALLRDGACSVYGERPTVCRQVTSTDLAGCLDEFEGRDRGGEIVGSRYFHDHARNCRVPLLAALAARGLPGHAYELSAGLLRTVRPGAEAGWLAGEDLFAGLAPAPPEPAPIPRVVAEIAAEIAV